MTNNNTNTTEQERLVAEKTDLDKMIQNLEHRMVNGKFANASAQANEQLDEQLKTMKERSDALEILIAQNTAGG